MPRPDPLGDRMKAYEGVESFRDFDPDLPIVMRLDGRRFSRFTRGFQKPFDPDITNAMQQTCRALVDQTQARIGYVQSDEISLVLMRRSNEEEMLFAGRVHKLVSTCASLATAVFMKSMMPRHEAVVLKDLPTFDARAWSVPTPDTAADAILWRLLDARKNSVSAACRSIASAADMHGLDRRGMMDLMETVGLDFEGRFSSADRLGLFFRRQSFIEEIDDATWSRIPVAARPETRTVFRRRIVTLEAEDFLNAESRTNIIFPELGLPVDDDLSIEMAP